MLSLLIADDTDWGDNLHFVRSANCARITITAPAQVGLLPYNANKLSILVNMLPESAPMSAEKWGKNSQAHMHVLGISMLIRDFFLSM